MTAAFDQLASEYDRLWTRSPVGRLQREAVWRHIGALFHPGQSALDLGCGTGEDALRLIEAGLRVRAIDASAEMVRIARDRGVDAETLPIEDCGLLDESFDAVLSNFGALNCVEDLESLRQPLARLVRPGGYLVICVIGRFCAWETAWALLHRQPAKAFRRWRKSVMSSLGVRVFYPSRHRLEAAFRPHSRSSTGAASVCPFRRPTSPDCPTAFFRNWMLSIGAWRIGLCCAGCPTIVCSFSGRNSLWQ